MRAWATQDSIPTEQIRAMPHRLVVDQDEFENFCDAIREAGIVAFDTEFLSEHTYRPELCLLQFAIEDRCVAVDPFEIRDLDPWWELMCDDATTVIVHGGQAEVRFCLWATGRAPQRLVDIQLAEGLRSRSYPMGYSTLVGRVLGRNVHGKETRTDWRKRPLASRQVDYALEDVAYVPEIWNRQKQSLEALGRLEWAGTEFDRFVAELVQEVSQENWHRVSGIQRLNRRELAVACELHRWREAEAARRNRLPRRVLRDDLLIEIARRKPKSVRELMATRDMNRSDYRRVADQLVECVVTGLEVPDSKLPRLSRSGKSDKSTEEQVLGKILAIALANRCADMNVATQLVGTNQDLRHLVRHHVFGDTSEGPPRLMQGWRSEVCGDLLTDVLDGRISLRVADPQSDHPLVFEKVDENAPRERANH